MLVRRLAVENFRPYEKAELLPAPGVTLLYGGNAQGKTALIEALYLTCTGRSHRTVRDAELIRTGQAYARVAVEARRRDGPHDVEILLRPGEKKRILIGGSTASRSGELMGHVTGVLFSPEDLRMVKDGPAERRRFVDMELSQMRPAYYQRCSATTARFCSGARFCAPVISPAWTPGMSSWPGTARPSCARAPPFRKSFRPSRGPCTGTSPAARRCAWRTAPAPGRNRRSARCSR
jgi:hypothetical protein